MATAKVDTYWEELNAIVGDDRRDGKRLSLVVPIEIHGFDSQGHFFALRTVTRNISEGGCCLVLDRPVEQGAMLALRVVNRKSGEVFPAKPLLFQVAWVEADGGGWQAGAEKLQPENIWQVAFPKPQSLATH